jgi:hypothetical protein
VYADFVAELVQQQTKGSVMRNDTLQALSVLAIVALALCLCYLLIDRRSSLPKRYCIYVVQTAQAKILRTNATRWTWLVIAISAVGVLGLRSNGHPTAFYHYGRFSVSSSQAKPLPTATPIHHQVYGRFGAVASGSQSQ